MARFARWQIQGALGEESPLLRATSVQEMQSVQFMPVDSWTTAGFGFQMWRENDRTFVGHAGTCPGAQSQLLIRPQDRIAVIVLSNALGVETGRYAQRAYDVFAPALRAASSGAARQPASAPRFEGLYQRPLGSESAVMMWQGRLAVRSLPATSPLAGLELFEAVSDSVFRRGTGPTAETIEFRTDQQGRLLLVRGHKHMVRRGPLGRE